jgi:hypothetical protein
MVRPAEEGVWAGFGHGLVLLAEGGDGGGVGAEGAWMGG